MSDGKWSSFGQLLLEGGKNTAVASENVAEADCYKPRVLMLQSKQYQFRNSFGDAHDVSRPHGLVGRKHYKIFDFELAGDQGHVISTENVIYDSLKTVQFHHRYML